MVYVVFALSPVASGEKAVEARVLSATEASGYDHATTADLVKHNIMLQA